MRPQVIPESKRETDGTLKDLCVFPTRWKGQFGFGYEAFEAVKEWRYVPASRLGQPVEAPVAIRVNF